MFSGFLLAKRDGFVFGFHLLSYAKVLLKNVIVFIASSTNMYIILYTYILIYII